MKTNNWPKGMRYAIVLLFTLYAAVPTASAQSEGGLLLEAGAEKKLSRQWSLSLDADFRTRNNFKTVDRWSIGLSAEYKPLKWLKASAGYILLDNHFREDISYQTLYGIKSYNNWRPSYWGIRHRLHASLTGSHKFANNIRISLRERWQYTYRPEKTVERWDFDNSQWEDKVRSGKGKNQLRSRLQVEYDKKRSLFTPFVSTEFYHAWAIEKVRFNVGTDIRLNKAHSLTVFYRFQKMHNVDEDEYDPDMHYLGLGYKFKF
ncbi:MAG: DUF2490 domain-containing protein [Prevotella sp.]|nr:DUF2490 domain-containing protein [Prevotella sp.]